VVFFVLWMNSVSVGQAQSRKARKGSGNLRQG
jgi:hypothetical protein